MDALGGGLKAVFAAPAEAARPAEAAAVSVDFAPCPMCAEPIRVAAIKCRYCGELLEKDGASGGSGHGADDDPPKTLG